MVDAATDSPRHDRDRRCAALGMADDRSTHAPGGTSRSTPAHLPARLFVATGDGRDAQRRPEAPAPRHREPRRGLSETLCLLHRLLETWATRALTIMHLLRVLTVRADALALPVKDESCGDRKARGRFRIVAVVQDSAFRSGLDRCLR